MMQKCAIIIAALLGVACVAMFFILKAPPRHDVAESSEPHFKIAQLDTVRLGKISPYKSGIVAGNASGELRFFTETETGIETQIFPLSKYEISAPVLCAENGLCYVGDANGMFWAFDPITGTTKWSYKTYNQITGQAVYCNNMVFVGSHDCDFYAFNSETGYLIFNVECGAQINASPVVSERLNAAFFGNCDGFLRKIDICKYLSESVVDTLDMESPIPENIAVYNDMLYVLAHQGSLAAVDCETFEITYRVKTPNEYLSAPYATESFLFLTDATGKIHAHSRGDGSRLATLPTTEKMTPLQAGDDDRVYAVSQRGKLFAWRRENDQWHETLLADLQTDCLQGCVLVDKRLFVADETGGLFYVEVSP